MSAEASAALAEPEVDPRALRAMILADPALVLDDSEMMQALIAADGDRGRNVVDLRGALVKRLEARLDRLERTHRSVIAAAYENLMGASQVHRAILTMLDARDLDGLLSALLDDTMETLAVDAARLCIEGEHEAAAHPNVTLLPVDGVGAYLALGSTDEREGVWLRETPSEAELVFGEHAAHLRSEAIISLDLGVGAPRAALVYGAEDAKRFTADQGVDLVAFLGAAAGKLLGPALAKGWRAA